MPEANITPWGEPEHPLRRALVEEMHIRRLPNFSAPARALQLVVLTTGTPAESVRAYAEGLCTALGLETPPAGKHFAVRANGLDIVWEQHSEYNTYTFIKHSGGESCFAGELLSSLPSSWLAGLPGRLLRATQIELLAPTDPEPTTEQLAAWFYIDELVACDVSGGEARIWSSFRLHDDGLGRLLIQDRGLRGSGDPARLVQRLQELGNYRNMALLGLSLAQRLMPQLSQHGERLARLTQDIAAGARPDDDLLHELTELSAQLAAIQTESSYRMSATLAYSRLVTDRLASLEVRRIAGYQTLTDFTDRRLTPAVRTCDSFTSRISDLMQRASWVSSLLRARIETHMEQQNRNLLESMNRRVRTQILLQQAVEGLSVVAISYYALGLAGYALKAINHYLPSLDPVVCTGALVPVLVPTIWWLLHRMRLKLTRRAADPQ